MTEGTPRPVTVELGVFDLSRLPVQWGDVDPEKLQAAVETIESSVPEQTSKMSDVLQTALPRQVQYPPLEIFLGSRFAYNVDPVYYNNCFWQLPRPIIAPEGYSLYVQLIDMTIPVSWHLYTLTPGNYSIRTLTAALNTLLPSATIVFNDTTLKLTLTSAVPVTVDGSLCSILGIAPGTTGTSLSSVHTVDLTGQNSIYILTDFSSNNQNIDVRGGGSSVFCRLPCTAAPMQVLHHEDYNGKSGLLIDTDNIASVHLKLEDENFNPLLATIHWEATLQITFVYTGRMHLQVETPLGLRVAPEQLI
eukprot:15622-Heterococcus_DN1.PRE.1